MKRPRKSAASVTVAIALAAVLANSSDDSFVDAAAAAADGASGVKRQSHHHIAAGAAEQQHHISPMKYRSVVPHKQSSPSTEHQYYPGPIARSTSMLSGEQERTQTSVEAPIVMNSFEHRGLLRRLPRRRRAEDVGLAGDASIADEEIEPGTPGGWWEKLYISGDYPEGRRGASAAVLRVMNATHEDDRRRATLSGENRPAPHTTSHVGASSSSASEMTRTPPSPGDPLPIPDHMSPSSSTTRPQWRPPDYDLIQNEYMVVSGGFSDDDWSTFPVWAFDMSDDSQPAEFYSYKWYNLGDGSSESDGGPEARVGHMSAIHEGHLYVFGGLLYDHSNFFLEKGPFVWKAKIDGLLPPSRKLNDEPDGKLQWERLIPKIVDPSTEDIGDKPALAIGEDGRFEPIPSRPMNEDEAEAGGDDDTTANDPDLRNLGAIPAKQAPSQYRLPRGEIEGGYWRPSNPDGDKSALRSAFVFYGGLYVTHKTMPRKYSANPLLQVDEPLGDVWAYNFDSNEFHRLAPYPPEQWQTDPDTGLYPVARTAHGATVVGDLLIIHGGMKINTEAISYSGETDWEPLSDCWEFDLKERVWCQRIIEPHLARSYHSLVGWGDGSIAAFAGYRSADTIAGEMVAFVFSDVLVNHPDEDYWLKAQWPQIYSARTISNRLDHVAVLDKEGSMFAWGGRFKTTSQVSGTWKIDVFNEYSTVIMAPAPPDGYDAFEAELEALHLLVAVMMFMSIIFTALYGSVRRQQMEMAAAMEGNGPVPGIMTLAGGSRRSGLSQAAIDMFPVKMYNRNRVGLEGKEAELDESNFVIDSEDDEVNGSGGDGPNGNLDVPSGVQGLEEEETCPICLVEYSDGDEIRTLSCGHDFHRGCVDEWLRCHTSCPGCRRCFSDSPLDTNQPTPEGGDLAEENYDPTWENLRRSVWGESPAFLSPQMLSLANILATRDILPAERPGEDPAGTAAPQDASGVSNPETPPVTEDAGDTDEFTNDEHGIGMRDPGMRRPRRLRIGRARGYRSVRPQATEMVELGTGSSNVV